MFGFAWMFWLLPFLFFLAISRRRRCERLAYAHHGGRPRLDREEDDREYVESLERRVTDLEERLDFTERLLARRNQEAPGSV